jgi:UDP-N-acetylmuramoyl-tripeptide--D-alanyl-D-alanine ligase
MLELGDMEEELHRGVGDKAAEVQVDTLITVGRRAAFIADEALKKGLSDVRHYENNAQALDAVLGLIQAGSVIYLKASHAMAFDTLASDLKQALEQ